MSSSTKSWTVIKRPWRPCPCALTWGYSHWQWKYFSLYASTILLLKEWPLVVVDQYTTYIVEPFCSSPQNIPLEASSHGVMCYIHRGSKARGWHLEVCMGFLSPASFWFLLCQCSHLVFLAGLGDWGWGWGMMLKRAHWQTFLKHHKIFRNKVPQMTFALMNYAFQQLPAFFTAACFFFILENICLVICLLVCQ